jgi:hypothetical protein
MVPRRAARWRAHLLLGPRAEANIAGPGGDAGPRGPAFLPAIALPKVRAADRIWAIYLGGGAPGSMVE